jgi:cytochrome c biogenesis protein CcmG/thiol:disulfide interchange protein DsbE
MIPSAIGYFRQSWTAAVLAAVAVAGCGEAPRHPAVGVALRGLPIASVRNPTLRPPGLSGQVTLLNFWGTWCPPCRRELPGLVRIAQGLADDQRFQFIPVSIGAGGDDGDLAAETARFLTAQRLDIAAWVFSDSLTGMMFSESIGLTSLPTTYLIGPDARIRRVWNGYRPSDEADIAAAILGLLKEIKE